MTEAEKMMNASKDMSVWDLIDREVNAREDKGERYYLLVRHIENFGYVVPAAPLIGGYDLFCNGLQDALDILEEAIVRVRRDYRVRGYSKSAMRYLHRELPNVGFSVSLPEARKTELRITETDERLGQSFENYIRKDLGKPRY